MSATAWLGPPGDTLGYPVPIQRFVARTNQAVVALQHVVAFTEGCSFTLHLAVRRDSLDESVWAGLVESHFGGDPEVTQTEGDLKFGVRFPDGATATTVDHPFHGWAHPTDRPEPPMLTEAGGESSSSDRSYQGHRQLWLWPLPPPGPFEFVIEWHNMGIDTTSIVVDGTAIARAAEQAQPYWP